MFQITALYNGREEVGYAEGEDLEDAMLEVMDSVPMLYPVEDVEYVVRGDA